MENKPGRDETKCSSCGKNIPIEDWFCTHCGNAIRRLSAAQERAIRNGPRWVLAVSIMFLIFGTYAGHQQQLEADKANASLSRFEDNQIWSIPVNGKSVTVGGLKAIIEKEVLFIYAVNYFLAVVMFVLFLWGRRSPFPALITALCVYLAVIVLNGIVEPSSLFKGVLVKILVIMALSAGIKAALVGRRVSS